MSFEDGWAAINLEMPDRVPRAEYSATTHWELIKAVTGIDVGVESSPEDKERAGLALMKAWNFDFWWRTLIGRAEFGDHATDMGHAVYAAGGVDRREIGRHPYTDPEQVLSFDPWEVLGEKDPAELTRRFEFSYREGCEKWPDMVNMTGVYVTLISGFIDLFGWEMLLLAAGLDPARFGQLANRYASWMQQYMDALAAADVPVVMIHDDCVLAGGPIFHPDWYREYVFPNYRKYLAPLKESGKRIMFTADGNYDEFIDDLADCGVDGFVMEPLTDMAAIAEKYGRTHVIVGNVDTRVLLNESKAAIRSEVERCMAIGKQCPGFFLAVGNHIPPNTPVDNAIYYNQIYEELSRR